MSRRSAAAPQPAGVEAVLAKWTAARKKMVELEVAAEGAWAAFQAAVHESELAERAHARAALEASWGAKEATAYGEVERIEVAKAEFKQAEAMARLQPVKAPAHMQKAAAARKKGRGGCCGGKVLEDVIEIQIKDERHSVPVS